VTSERPPRARASKETRTEHVQMHKTCCIAAAAAAAAATAATQNNGESRAHHHRSTKSVFVRQGSPSVGDCSDLTPIVVLGLCTVCSVFQKAAAAEEMKMRPGHHRHRTTNNHPQTPDSVRSRRLLNA